MECSKQSRRGCVEIVAYAHIEVGLKIWNPHRSSGGATVFPNLDVKIDAVPKSALFFAYKGSDGNMLGEATEHVGCLIKNGTKKIVTSWLREGVEKARPAKFFYDRGVT